MTTELHREKLLDARDTTLRRRATRDRAADELRLVMSSGDAERIERSQATLDDAQHLYEAAVTVEDEQQRRYNTEVWGLAPDTPDSENPPPLSGRVHKDAAGTHYKETTRSKDGRVVERLHVPKEMADDYLEEQDAWVKRWRQGDKEVRSKRKVARQARDERPKQTKEKTSKPKPKPTKPKATKPKAKKAQKTPATSSRWQKASTADKAAAGPTLKRRYKTTVEQERKQMGLEQPAMRVQQPASEGPTRAVQLVKGRLQKTTVPPPATGIRVKVSRSDHYVHVPKGTTPTYVGDLVVHREITKVGCGKDQVDVILGERWSATVRETGSTLSRRWPTKGEAIEEIKRANAAEPVRWTQLGQGGMNGMLANGAYERWQEALSSAQPKAPATKRRTKPKPKTKTAKPAAQSGKKRPVKRLDPSDEEDAEMMAQLKSLMTPEALRELRRSIRDKRRKAS